ncbi:ATP-binding cassette domain-containing protein [Neisseria bacilliformis]
MPRRAQAKGRLKNTAMDNILDVRNLNAFFGRSQVLHDIGFAVARGSKTAIVGESGSGKTVLAQGIMRLNPAVSKAV